MSLKEKLLKVKQGIKEIFNSCNGEVIDINLRQEPTIVPKTEHIPAAKKTIAMCTSYVKK